MVAAVAALSRLAPQAPPLRPYQREAIAAVIRDLHDVRSVLVEACTGSGKTSVASELARRAVAAGGRVLFTAHRRELLDQAAARLRLFGLDVTRDVSSWAQHDVTVASIQTLARRLLPGGDLPRWAFTLIICDEGHHAAARSYRNVFDHFETARLVLITATTDRADGVSLGTVAERCSYRYGIVEAVEAGYLVPARGIQVEVPGMDLSSVRAKAVGEGDTPKWIVDLHQGDLGKVVIDPKAVEGITGPLVALTHHVKGTTGGGGAARDMRTIVFAVNRRHARALAASLNARVPGSARAVDGSMKAKEREEVLREHRAGAFTYLVNVALLCEGYDDVGIECVAMAAPTQSRIKYTQCAGRGLRPAPGKQEALLIDFIGVSCVHDLVGPEDVLGGALVGPIERFGAESTAPARPVVDVEYEPRPVAVKFSAKVVKLIRKGARAVGRGLKAAAVALVG